MADTVVVDQEVCEGHALCVSFAPEVFWLTEDERSQVRQDEITEDRWPDIELAIASCPVQAISRAETTEAGGETPGETS